MKKDVRQVSLGGKRVLVRVDFNVPLTDDRKVSDDTRIRETLPTITHLTSRGARLILVSHLGRPDGKPSDKLRMAPVATKLTELLGRPVRALADCVGPEVSKAASELKNGDVLLLENVRFYPGEEKNDPEFAKSLASCAEAYVNDAFGTAHRAHASTVGVTKFLSPCVAGLLMAKELEHLGKLLGSAGRPFVAILGGKKVSDKIEVIRNLLPRVDRLLIGGGMMFTFLKAQRRAIGKSVLEADKVDLARDLLATSGGKIVLPPDAVIADKIDASAATRTVPTSTDIPDGWAGVDVGPETVKTYAKEIEGAKTVLWNGPMGIFEMAPFAKGTFGVAEAMARCQGVTVIGGGDSVAAVHQAGVAAKMTHISTGGGASLEFLEGKTLPGVAALNDA